MSVHTLPVQNPDKEMLALKKFWIALINSSENVEWLLSLTVMNFNSNSIVGELADLPDFIYKGESAKALKTKLDKLYAKQSEERAARNEIAFTPEQMIELDNLYKTAIKFSEPRAKAFLENYKPRRLDDE